jgi:hypothetical protein
MSNDTPKFLIAQPKHGAPVSGWAITLPTAGEAIVGFTSVQAAKAFAGEWFPKTVGIKITPTMSIADTTTLLAECLRVRDNGFL